MLVSTTRVAQELGISRRRVTELVRTGKLEATNFAGRWVVEASEVAKYRILQRISGRPWDSDLAWDMILALSGQGGDLTTRAELRLLNVTAELLISQVQRLISVDWFQARSLNPADPHVFLTGDSAINRINHDLLGSSNSVHLYTDVSDVSRHFDAVNYPQGNLAVYRWRDGRQRIEGSVPPVLIAIDAARSTDARVRAAGIEYVDQELTAWQETHTQ